MYQSQDSLSSDFLRLKQQPKFQCILQPKQQLILSTNIFKYNSEGKCQQRILVITNLAILNILKSENIIKTFIKKFINFQNKYQIKRRILLSNLYGITLTPDRNSNVFLIHVSNEHDYHYRAANNKMLLIKAIADEYKKTTKYSLPFYFKEQAQICNFFTTKSHLRQKKDIKPKDIPIFLNDQYFLDQKFGNQLYVCQFSHLNDKVQPKNFSKVEIKEYKQGNLYFILKEQFDRSVQVQNLHRSQMLLNPYYSFYSQKKQLLFIPFMAGGNLRNFLSKIIPINKQNVIFYLTQILIFLSEFHSKGFIYCNLILENIFVKQNGFVVLNGLQKSIIQCSQQKIIYRIFGNPYYFPPQVIQCKGYREQIDVWKLGICAYYLLKGKYPFEGRNIKQLYSNILNKTIQLDESIPNFVKLMLEKDKSKRIKINELLKMEQFEKQKQQLSQKQSKQAPYIPDITNWNTFVPIIYRLDKKIQDQ